MTDTIAEVRRSYEQRINLLRPRFLIWAAFLSFIAGGIVGRLPIF